jgi:putative FmdB family regulatory protein
MPLYEYECDENKHRFEVIQKFSDPPIEKCPTCGSTVHKLISSPAFQFKGTGWYITDYAKKNSPPNTPASGSDAKNSSDSDAKKETSSSSGESSAGSSSDSKSTPATPSAKPD